MCQSVWVRALCVVCDYVRVCVCARVRVCVCAWVRGLHKQFMHRTHAHACTVVCVAACVATYVAVSAADTVCLGGQAQACARARIRSYLAVRYTRAVCWQPAPTCRVARQHAVPCVMATMPTSVWGGSTSTRRRYVSGCGCWPVAV